MSAALYAAWDGVTPATLLPEAVALLRDRVGFRGAILSADLVAVTGATGGTLADAAVEALRAGCDLVVVPGSQADRDAAYRGALAAVESGDLPRERIDEALLRVLSLKQRVGLAGT
jgi:beta-N-acetylhexosaminidase